MTIPIVGKCFATADAFMTYLEGIQFGAWRPRYVVMHHTGAPDLKTWQGWQTRNKPVSDEQWMQNLKGYYENPAYDSEGRKIKDAWTAAPQFFFTPKHFCVLSLPTKRGTHAVSFNANSWGVECVGDFDREPFDGPARARYVDGLAALHLAAGLQLLPFEKKVRGLHFHRNDPLTSKTCPGRNVDKPSLISDVQRAMEAATAGDHPEEHVTEPVAMARRGTVKLPANETLNVRATASGKAPVLATLLPGAAVSITGEAMNGETAWLRIDLPGDADGWVAGRFIDRA